MTKSCFCFQSEEEFRGALSALVQERESYGAVVTSWAQEVLPNPSGVAQQQTTLNFEDYVISVLVGVAVGLLLGWKLRGLCGWCCGFFCKRREEARNRQGPGLLATLFDAGRGRILPPPSSSSGKRYYALSLRSAGRIGVYAGYSKFKSEIPRGKEPGELPRGSFISTQTLDQALRCHPYQGSAIYLPCSEDFLRTGALGDIQSFSPFSCVANIPCGQIERQTICCE